MFGLGWLEIIILVVLLVLVFGADNVAAIAGRLFGTAQKVNSVKRDLTNPASWLTRLTGDKKSNQQDPPS